MCGVCTSDDINNTIRLDDCYKSKYKILGEVIPYFIKLKNFYKKIK